MMWREMGGWVGRRVRDRHRHKRWWAGKRPGGSCNCLLLVVAGKFRTLAAAPGTKQAHGRRAFPCQRLTGCQHCVVKARRYRTAGAPSSNSSSGDRFESACRRAGEAGEAAGVPKPAPGRQRCTPRDGHLASHRSSNGRAAAPLTVAWAGGSGGVCRDSPWPVPAASSSRRSAASAPAGWGSSVGGLVDGSHLEFWRI